MKSAQLFKRVIQKVVGSVKTTFEDSKYQKLAQDYNLNGYKRVYLVHIRKTGGTSLNNMFLSLSGEDPNVLYSKLAKTPSHRIRSNGLIYVGWTVKLIEKGYFFYAFSHTPFHQLHLPPRTFTVSCFRDPIKRIVSHYNMLMDFRVNKTNHPCMAIEGKWLGKNFSDFLCNIPKKHLLNQLYMFSQDFDIDEAVANVNQLSHYFFTEQFAKGVNAININTGLNLEPMHIRKASYKLEIPVNELAKLREMTGKEYSFLHRIKEMNKA